jgi:hypothetical protein
MQDDDRADRLARAIEEMVQGDTPEDLDDEELHELLQIARIRLDAAHLAAQAGAEAQDSVLERLLARLGSLQKSDGREIDGNPDAATNRVTDVASDDDDLDRMNIKDMQEVVGLRRQMAEHVAAISETHREAVWQRVQSRIQAERSEKRGLVRWPFRGREREADDFGAAVDRMILGEPIWEAKDSRLEELLRVARIRRAAAATANTGFVDQQARIWARLRPRIMARLMPSRSPHVFQGSGASPWPKLAAAAGLALVIGLLGPLPATGLAHHPVTEFARFLGGSVGVTETSVPPAVPPVTQVVESGDVSAEQASGLLGVPAYEPTSVPTGYRLVSSQYFPKPLTADEGGLFVLTYEGPSPADDAQIITIFQEHASSNTIAVQRGFAQTIWLSSSVPGTYVMGTWQSTGSDLTWGEDAAQTIVFDLNGLRTIIQTADIHVRISDLVALGESMAEQAPPAN